MTDGFVVERVDFYSGTTKIATVYSSPEAPLASFQTQVALTTANNGFKDFTAKAFGYQKTTSWSPTEYLISSNIVTVAVNIKDITAPKVSLSSNLPTGTTSLNTADVISLHATATDNVRVKKLELYSGTVLLKRCANSACSYSALFAGNNNGNKSFTAKAYDDAGNVTTSAILPLSVNVTPVPAAKDVVFAFDFANRVHNPVPAIRSIPGTPDVSVVLPSSAFLPSAAYLPSSMNPSGLGVNRLGLIFNGSQTGLVRLPLDTRPLGYSINSAPGMFFLIVHKTDGLATMNTSLISTSSKLSNTSPTVYSNEPLRIDQNNFIVSSTGNGTNPNIQSGSAFRNLPTLNKWNMQVVHATSDNLQDIRKVGLNPLHATDIYLPSRYLAPTTGYITGAAAADGGALQFGDIGYKGTIAFAIAYNRSLSDSEANAVIGYARKLMDSRGVTLP